MISSSYFVVFSKLKKNSKCTVYAVSSLIIKTTNTAIKASVKVFVYIHDQPLKLRPLKLRLLTLSDVPSATVTIYV